MSYGPLGGVIRQFRRYAGVQLDGSCSDCQILTRFLQDGDELAFETIVRRHGPMVLGVCRRILQNHHDAEDAFQATFLVLGRKAGTIKPRSMLGNWLHGVAYRTALKARAARARRQTHERVAGGSRSVEETHEAWNELRLILDRELGHLPDKYRLPIILCDLEGKTHTETAKLLGWPKGTVSTRLIRGRSLLGRRLSRCGVVLSSQALLFLLSEQGATACVPSYLVSGTVKAGLCFAAREAGVSDVISANVLTLTEGVLNSMARTKLGIATLVVLMGGICGLAIGMQPQVSRTEGAAAGNPQLDDKKSQSFSQGAPKIAEKQEKRYKIECIVVQVDPAGEDLGENGKGRIIGEPTIVISENQEGSFLSGGAYPFDASNEKAIDFFYTGIKLNIKVGNTLRDGAYRLDAIMENSQSDRDGGEVFEMRSYRVRYNARVRLGEWIKIAEPKVPGLNQHWAKLRIVKEETVLTRTKSAEATPVNPVRIGDIVIEGNKKTENKIILDQLNLYPGQVLSLPDLRAAEKNLEKLGLFRVEPQNKIRPRVTVLDPESPSSFKDILVTVAEKPPVHYYNPLRP